MNLTQQETTMITRKDETDVNMEIFCDQGEYGETVCE